MIAAALRLAVLSLCLLATGAAAQNSSDRLPDTSLSVDGGTIDLVFADGAPGLDRTLITDWIRTSAKAVSTYFGGFPVSHVRLMVIADNGRSINGTTFGSPQGSFIRLRVGTLADAATLKEDWVLVHEMTHLALPQLPRWALWLQEGNATYVEPIARAQAGQLGVAEVWKWTLDDMPGAQPKPGDSGLNATRDHQRIYWGGAAFWLVADVRIRERTHNRIGVQTALRAIDRASGGNTGEWTVDQLVATGDAATGGHELADLYAQMGTGGTPVDIDTLLKQLGTSVTGGNVVFDDSAPLAAIRRQITAPAN
jgi:hypothetical protein